MKCTMIFIMFMFSISFSFPQQQYFVSKDGTGNFSSITQVNSASLNSGDIVAFKGGEKFADAVLNCKSGVTYTSFGNSQAIIGDSLGNTSTETTINVGVENVTIDNLKVYGYKYSWRVISYSQGNLTIKNCEIVGGLGAHNDSRNGIYQLNHSAVGGRNLNFQKNVIHGFGGAAIYWSRPYNADIGYNEMYDLWRENAIVNQGAQAMGRAVFGDGQNPEDIWDCAYTVNIHHNNIHHFEMAAFMGYSRMIIEYNEIHNNLDERIYRGGAKHGSVGKMWDGDSDSWSLGLIFRYNYVHDLIRRGQAGYTYGKPYVFGKWQTGEDVVNTVNTNNGQNTAVYLDAGSYAASYGDYDGNGILDYDGGPDNVLSGLGYANYWIHNNIFYKCSNMIAGRSFNYASAYRPNLHSYFINNTIINCGGSYVAASNGIITTFVGNGNSNFDPNSPHNMANNIFDYVNPSGHYVCMLQSAISSSYNIFLNHEGITEDPSSGVYYAYWKRWGGQNSVISDDQYFVSDADIWTDTSSTYFAANIGTAGSNIPNVLLKSGSAAYNSGKAYSTLGDTYYITSALNHWNETHSLGQDPSGRSFAYDILGNYRTTNDIGAVGLAAGSPTPQTGLKVILEGSYLDGKMRTDLNSSKFIPLNQPYNVSPWNIVGDIIINNPSENYVDWILVQVRDNLTNTKYWKVGILTEDGTVLNPNGSSFSFSNISSGEYYIVIKHRNHLGIMSAQKIPIEKGISVEYNFTDSQNKAYGENSMVKFDDGKYAMIAGDGDANGVVNVLDFGTVANNILLRGYAQGDIDMNGSVNVLDYSFINRNLLKKTNLP